MGSYGVISSDSHIVEPPDLWTSRLEQKFKDRAPRIIRGEDGNDWWFCEDVRLMSMAGGTQTGVRFEEPELLSMMGTFENVRPGGYIPEEHVKDMEADGVDAGVLYPTTGSPLYRNIKDSEFLSALFRAYNDWLADFCKPFPDKLKGIGILNIDDVQDGVREMERCANIGLAGALIPVYPPEGRGYESSEYEPLWAAAQDLQMPLSLHLGTIRPGGNEFSDIAYFLKKPSFVFNIDHWVRMSLGDMIFSGVFERYPKLNVGAVEHELSWAPHFLERMDYTYTQRAHRDGWYRFKEDMLPSDYFHRNVFVGFQEDALGVRDRHIIGVDNLLWGSDYPHQESTFPRTRQILDDILADCTEAEKAKIVGGNARRIYHLD